MTANEAISKAATAYLPATYRRILQQLAVEPLDSKGIADYLGMTLKATYKLVMVLKGLKVICVVEYRRESVKGAPIKTWGLGSKDVRPPPKVAPAARSKAWRERNGQMPRIPKLDAFTAWATTGAAKSTDQSPPQ
jgi:hypothetical protein